MNNVNEDTLVKALARITNPAKPKVDDPAKAAWTLARISIIETLMMASNAERMRPQPDEPTMHVWSGCIATKCHVTNHDLYRAYEVATLAKLKAGDHTSEITWFDLDNAIISDKGSLPKVTDKLLPPIAFPELWTDDVKKYALTYARREFEKEYTQTLKYEGEEAK